MNDTVSAMIDALPHRPPFRFLSEITGFAAGQSGEAIWRVTGDEGMLAGHFPGFPIVPGTLITEALAQLSGLVAFYPFSKGTGATACPPEIPGRPATLAHTEVRFNESVIPPAAILLRSRLRRAVGTFRQFDVSAECNDHVVARGELTLSAAGACCAEPS
jgi:3-hydroxyacyl-[acyl-carrier-protein] dehydratase